MALNNAINAPLPLAFTQGGTGATSQGAAFTAVLGSSVVPFTNGGTGATSQGAALTAILGSSLVGVASGGTGAATLTSHGILLGNGTSAVTAAAELADGQLLMGRTGNTPLAITLSPGTGIAITSNATGITIAATDSMSVAYVSGTSQPMVKDVCYVSNNSGLTTYTLPTTAVLGDAFAFSSSSANTSFSRVKGGTATQLMRLGIDVSTANTGYITSTDIGAGITLVCVDDTVSGSEVFQAIVAPVGNFNVT